MAGQVEDVAKDIGAEPSAVWTRWNRELELARRHEKQWRERSEDIIKRYRDDDRPMETGKTYPSRFNILYANTEVLKGVAYARAPVPDVRRRFLDKDPAGRDAAQILQRALAFSADAYDFDGTLRACVEDYLLPGRCSARVRYKPTMGPITDPATGQPVIGPDGQPAQQVVYEEVSCEYVEWDMVHFSPAKRWEKVRWVAFGELLTREDLVRQFGERGQRCTLDWCPKGEEGEKEQDFFKRALVWEIWDKTTRTVKVWSKGFDQGLLDERPDPLRLEAFFPCPKPPLAISTTGSMIPVPLFLEYQDQAIELDTITDRIDKLVDALRRRGVYDASYPELSKIADAGDNQFIPIENFVNLAEKGGIAAALYESPVDMIAKVLMGLYDQRDRCKQIIYEITGIADIVRGATRPNETLGAQELKARYANSRIGPMQAAIAGFARDLMRLKAEVIAERFSPQVLAMMTGITPTPEAMAVLRSDKLRGFKVDIETDSTIQPDATEEQRNRIEFLTAISGFIQQAAPAVQSGTMPLDVAKELLSFGARGFKVSPQLEDALDRLGSDRQGNDQQKQQQMMIAQQTAAAGVRKVNAEADEAEAKALKARLEAQILERQLAMGTMPQPQAVPPAVRFPIPAPAGPMPMAGMVGGR